MSKFKKIGVVIADRDEYLPLKGAAADFGVKPFDVIGREGIKFDFCGSEVYCINCGIGKVNAAAAAMYLISSGCTLILNYGLSGGISGSVRASVIVPDRFLEHDFDLTPLGYKPCEKPNQRYIYDASPVREVIADALEGCGGGTAVCGDRFICSKADSDFFAQSFGATSCDMETAAIASVCDMTGVQFAAIRRVSDNADESARESYTEMNVNDGLTLAEIFMKALAAVCENGE